MRSLITIFALWAAGLGAAAQFAKLAVSFAALAEAYPGAGGLLGFAVSFLSLSGLLFGLVAGSVVARRGAKSVLVGALVLGAALSALEALLPPLPIFLAARIAEGLSHLGLVVAAPTLIAELAPVRWRAAAMTLWSTFFGVAFAFLAWIAPGIIAAYGLGALIGGHAVYMGAMALVLLVLLPAVRPDRAAGRAIIDPLRLYGDAALSAPAWGWLFYTLTFVALLTLLPDIMGPGMPAWLPSALPLASIVASLTLGVALLRRLPAIPVTIGAFSASALVALVVLATGGATLPTVALFLCLGIVQAGSFAAIPELNPALRERALANGAVAQMGNLGNLTGTPLLMMLIGAAGPRAALAAIAGAYVAGAAAHAVLARARRA